MAPWEMKVAPSGLQPCRGDSWSALPNSPPQDLLPQVPIPSSPASGTCFPSHGTGCGEREFWRFSSCLGGKPSAGWGEKAALLNHWVQSPTSTAQAPYSINYSTKARVLRELLWLETHLPLYQLLHTWSACPVGTGGHPAPLHPTLSGAQWCCGVVLPLPLPRQQQRDGMVSCCCPALPSTPGSDKQSPGTVYVVWVNHRAFRLQWCPKCCFHCPPRTYHCRWYNICVEVSAPLTCPPLPRHPPGLGWDQEAYSPRG